MKKSNFFAFLYLIFLNLFLCANSFSQVAPSSFQPDFLAETKGGEVLSVDKCKPEYPYVSLRNEETGIVRISFTVDMTGRTKDLLLIKSSGFKRLDAEVLRKMKNCLFRPFRFNNFVFERSITINYHWVLN